MDVLYMLLRLSEPREYPVKNDILMSKQKQTFKYLYSICICKNILEKT
jgi:hypothetical protein